jgi:hypothetical protein
MPLYTFRLEKFHVRHKRSNCLFCSDTDVVAVSLQVGDRKFDTQTIKLDPVDEGDHQVGLEYRFVPIEDPASPVTFTWQIVNAGDFHGNIHDKLSSAAETIGSTLLGAGAGLVATGASGALGGALLAAGIGVEIFNFLGNLLDPNCDGPVAADGVSRPVSDFDAIVPVLGGTFTQSRDYPGADSAYGCGGNSFYTVTWSFTITPAETPTLTFPTLVQFGGPFAAGTGASQTIVFRNEGQVDVTISVPASAAQSPFSWPALNAVIPPNSQQEMGVDFEAPVIDGPPTHTEQVTDRIRVDTNVPGSPTFIRLVASVRGGAPR